MQKNRQICHHKELIMLKNILSTALIGAAVASGAAYDLPPTASCHRFDFEHRFGLGPYPASAQKYLSLIPGLNGKALQVKPLKGGATVYNSIQLKTPGPGTLEISFDYKFIPATGQPFNLIVNYNLPGKGNGSAGRSNCEIPPAKEWTRFSRIFTVPAKANAVQYVFGINGSGTTVVMDNFDAAYSPDSVTVPFAADVDFSASASSACWNPRMRQYGFYAFGKDAVTPASMQVAADDSGIGFIFRNTTDPSKLKTSNTRHDSSLWDDDANEIILFDEKREIGWQFIVSANGTAMDAKLFQKAPGDPWQPDISWNGKWLRSGQATKNGFETRFFIPWKTLGIDPAKGAELRFNAYGDFQTNNDFPSWSVYRGTRHDVGKFGTLSISNNKVTLTRARVNETLSYAIKRPNAKFNELIQKGIKGNYLVDLWTDGMSRNDFSKAQLAKITDADFKAWQTELLRAWLTAGIGGPAWPWVINTLGQKRVEELHKQGMKFAFHVSNSSLHRMAQNQGAKLIAPGNRHWGCDITDPVYADVLKKFIRGFQKSRYYDLMKASGKYAILIDEPTNSVEICYNPQSNPVGTDVIKEKDAEIRKTFGYGKYGVPFLNDVAEKDRPFAYVAFYRWWNREMKKSLGGVQKVQKEVFPDMPVLIFNDNNCSGQSYIDAANINGTAEIISTDPYPTATNAYFGMHRALYHVGFSCRVLKDLVPDARLMVMPQAFIYHGAHGDLAAMREWASQAMKNGAEHLMWYCSQSASTIFKDYAGMLELSAMIGKMDKINLPKPTGTLVWYSNFDKWAKRDRVMHPTYSLYAMLYEKVGSNFRFVSDTAVEDDAVKLDNYKLLYVPQMTYTTEKIAGKLLNWVKNGGTMVIFDPLFMTWNLDGSLNKERALFTGQTGTPMVKTANNSEVIWNNTKLPAAMISNAPALPGSRFASYTVNASGSKVAATYSDNTPAAVERNIGKGKVIYFGIQPFAGSDLVNNSAAWEKFFAAQADAVGEKINLPIRDFLLPDPPVVVNLKQIIK